MKVCDYALLNTKQILLRYPCFEKFSEYFCNGLLTIVYTCEDNTGVLIDILFAIKHIIRRCRFIVRDNKILFFEFFNTFHYVASEITYYSVGNIFFTRKNSGNQHYVKMIGIEKKDQLSSIIRDTKTHIDRVPVEFKMRWMKALLTKLIVS